MNSSISRCAITVAILVATLTSGSVAEEAIAQQVGAKRPYRPRVGQRHPDFTLPNTADGTPVSLSDYRGKKVLLIHFASW
ncbi:MAG: redoxin domain-containing protein [Pirellulales bacterium]|nr:redoxin domain-containing protein [Pirellulales bacterium]